ncbi:MAG: hypothetical protein LBS87_01020 [Puniceicoccales bacterium]|jgi:hypothetical protein|nr:hypothetical protein [Puniceicoccales bacterium]
MYCHAATAISVIPNQIIIGKANLKDVISENVVATYESLTGKGNVFEVVGGLRTVKGEALLNYNNFQFKNSRHSTEEIKLDSGTLLFSGNKISFLPRDGKVVYGYKIDDRGEAVSFYVNDLNVIRNEFFDIMETNDKTLRNSKFGETTIPGIKSLLDGESSRFLPRPDNKEFGGHRIIGIPPMPKIY